MVFEFFRGETTPQLEELLHFMKSLPEKMRNEMTRYIVGADIAILANGEDAQPYADIISIGVFTKTGKAPYRATIRIREGGIASIPPKKELANKKAIIVDVNYNKFNESLVDKELARDSYNVAGVMYFAPFPQPYASQMEIEKKED